MFSLCSRCCETDQNDGGVRSDERQRVQMRKSTVSHEIKQDERHMPSWATPIMLNDSNGDFNKNTKYGSQNHRVEVYSKMHLFDKDKNTNEKSQLNTITRP